MLLRVQYHNIATVQYTIKENASKYAISPHKKKEGGNNFNQESGAAGPYTLGIWRNFPGWER